ncbi:MAG: transporter [Sandaracinaceae bacterium]
MRDKLALLPATSLVLLLGLPSLVFAHGETARGGGSANALNAVGGLIGTGWSLGARLELRQFEEFSDEQLRSFALDGEDVHQHSQEMSAFLTTSVVLLPDLDLSLVLPFNGFRGFREAELDPATNTPHLITDAFSGGVGDLVAVGRYRVVREGDHHLALLAGIKIPTGVNRETDDEGDRLGTHNQPGTGSVDFQLGAAYTLAVGDFGLTADVIVHVRTEGVLGYQAGNLLQADLAASYQLGPVALVAELNHFVSERDVEYGEVLDNSGIHTLYVSPGVVVTIAEQHALYATASIPVVQALPGLQNQEVLRGGLGYSVTFGQTPAASPEPDHSHAHRHRPSQEAPPAHGHRARPHHHHGVDSEPDMVDEGRVAPRATPRRAHP